MQEPSYNSERTGNYDFWFIECYIGNKDIYWKLEIIAISDQLDLDSIQKLVQKVCQWVKVVLLFTEIIFTLMIDFSYESHPTSHPSINSEFYRDQNISVNQEQK